MEAMLRAAFFALAFGASALAADWTEYRSGPLQVLSNAGDGSARTELVEMEQIRYVLGGMFGSDPRGNAKLEALWPITLVLFDNEKDRAAYALPTPFVEGGSANLSTTPSPAWRSEIARQLVESNAVHMPPEFEKGLADLFATIQVKTTHVMIGAPPPPELKITGARLRGLAKVHMLATQEEYRGRMRVFMNNLQGGDFGLAAFNTYGISGPELEKRMNAYADRGVFEAVEVFGEAIDPAKSFYERRMPASEVDALLAELKAPGKFAPGSPRGLVSENTRESLYAAAAANPKWGEPHARLAALFKDPRAKIAPLEKAVQLEPRQTEYWEALARAQTDAGMFTEASKTWISAERSADSETERARIHKERAAIEEQRVDAELAATRAAKDEEERDLRRVMAESDARIKAAETSANRVNGQQATFTEGRAAVGFDEIYHGVTVSGRLMEVGCVDSILKLVIQGSNGSVSEVLVRASPEKDGKPVFTCGRVDPPRKIEVTHNGKADSRWNTVGEAETYDLK
jgi:hypothetical protein